MKAIKKQYLVLAILLGAACFSPLLAQPGPGGRPPGGGFDPNEMIQREKQNVYKAIADLSTDQKTLLDGIYKEFGDSFTEIRDEVRKTRDFKAMRPKMEALRKEKDGLIKDVLDADQYDKYLEVIKARDEQRRNRSGGRGQNNPPESVQ